jgi:hypothetical protein
MSFLDVVVVVMVMRIPVDSPDDSKVDCCCCWEEVEEDSCWWIG